MELLCFKLKEIGVDTESVIHRLGGNETLYLTICMKFLEDPSYQLLTQALQQEDFFEAANQLHTLMGVASNLGFIRIHRLCNAMSLQLREMSLSSFYRDLFSLRKEYQAITSILYSNQFSSK